MIGWVALFTIRERDSMRLFHFHLTRSIAMPGTCVEIESSFTYKLETLDALPDAYLVRKMFPGWTLDNIETPM